jgi:hypothetical protein
MFRWYRDADCCYAYLQDVDEEHPHLSNSAWFSRGWTLQELLAPGTITFFDRRWQVLGYKDQFKSKMPEKKDRPFLNKQLSLITGIPREVLASPDGGRHVGMRKKLAWMEHRETTKPEDTSYSLLGIFGVHMAAMYGEGADHARRRLIKEIRDAKAENVAFKYRQMVGIAIEGTDYLLPLSIFEFIDLKFGSRYTVVARAGYYEQVFEDGEVLLRIAIGSGHRYESYMQAAFQKAGSYEVPSPAEQNGSNESRVAALWDGSQFNRPYVISEVELPDIDGQT